MYDKDDYMKQAPALVRQGALIQTNPQPKQFYAKQVLDVEELDETKGKPVCYEYLRFYRIRLSDGTEFFLSNDYVRGHSMITANDWVLFTQDGRYAGSYRDLDSFTILPNPETTQ